MHKLSQQIIAFRVFLTKHHSTLNFFSSSSRDPQCWTVWCRVEDRTTSTYWGYLRVCKYLKHNCQTCSDFPARVIPTVTIDLICSYSGCDQVFSGELKQEKFHSHTNSHQVSALPPFSFISLLRTCSVNFILCRFLLINI